MKNQVFCSCLLPFGSRTLGLPKRWHFSSWNFNASPTPDHVTPEPVTSPMRSFSLQPTSHLASNQRSSQSANIWLAAQSVRLRLLHLLPASQAASLLSAPQLGSFQLASKLALLLPDPVPKTPGSHFLFESLCWSP